MMHLLLSLMLSGPAAAQSPSSAPLRLADVLAEAAARNPEVLAARQAWEAARAAHDASGWPEKPRLDFERMYSGDEKNVAVSQELPFPTSLYYQRKGARQESEMAFQRYRAKRLDVAARVRSAFAMYFLADRSLGLLDENVTLMRGFARTAESRYAAGKTGQLEALKAALELSKMQNMQVAEEQEKAAAAAMLAALLDRPGAAALASPEEPPLGTDLKNLPELRALAAERRPELREAGLRRDRAQTGVSQARSAYLPDLMLLYRRRQSPTPSLDGTQDAMVGLSIPLWFGRQNALLRQARAERAMAEADAGAMANMTGAETADAAVRAQTSRRLAELYRTSVLPQAEQALSVAQAAYESDRGSFLDLLDSQRSLLGSKLDYYSALADYQVRFGQLERLTAAEDEALR